MALANAFNLVWSATSDAIRPDPLLTVSEWANSYRILSTRASAEAGVTARGKPPLGTPYIPLKALPS